MVYQLYLFPLMQSQFQIRYRISGGIDGSAVLSKEFVVICFCKSTLDIRQKTFHMIKLSSANIAFPLNQMHLQVPSSYVGANDTLHMFHVSKIVLLRQVKKKSLNYCLCWWDIDFMQYLQNNSPSCYYSLVMLYDEVITDDNTTSRWI